MRPSIGLAALAVALTMSVLLNCADTASEPSPPVEPDAAGSDASADAAVDSAADAIDACEGGDPPCNQPLPCSETDFCPVATPIEGRHSINAVWGSGPSDVWVVGSGGTIARWDGATFRVIPSPTLYTLNGVWGTGSGDIWAVSTPDMILRRRGAGAWERVASVETTDYRILNVLLNAVWGPNGGSEVFVAGNPLAAGDPSAQLWRTDHDAVTWDIQSQVFGYTVHAMWGSATGDVWTVGVLRGSGGMAYRGKLTNGRIEDWIATDIQASNILYSVWGSGPSDVWAVGTGGTIRHYDGSSPLWNIVPSPTREDLRAVWGSGPNDVWIAGDAGTLLHWDGVKWRLAVASFPAGRPPNLYGLWGSGPNDVWAVGQRAIVLRSSGFKARGDAR